MENRKEMKLYSAIGASSGIVGFALSSCPGGGCTSCFGCAAAGVVLLLLAAAKRLRGLTGTGLRREEGR
ncbi:MAG: hypothetical protein AB1805_00245 [Nitrospirota bacterium]